ncbi:MAG: hypothetical protein IKJ45_13185 [Kiritimatiellae bacterium]|nr:hypothetical protein [Kiritimatiellia bacterium]
MKELEIRDITQRIVAEVEAKQNEPQELWVSLRGLVVTDKVFAPLGLLHDVIEFCLAVFDSLEPNASFDERQKRVAHAEALAILLNPKMGGMIRGLSAKDNVFLVKWGVFTGAGMNVWGQRANAFFKDPIAADAFAAELRQADHEESIVSVWLYSLYSAIFTFAHGRIPAGVLGLASFGIGLAMSNGGTKQ